MIEFITSALNNTSWKAGTIEATISMANQVTLLTHNTNLSERGRVVKAKAKIKDFTQRKARYSEFFELDPIFDTLERWGPNEQLTEKQLRDKAIMLLRIDLMARNDDITTLYRHANLLVIRDDRLKVRLVDTKNAAGLSTWIHVHAFPERPLICSVTTLNEYLKRTNGYERKDTRIKPNREEILTDPLFFTCDKQHAQLSADTVGRISSQIMTEAKIDASYLPHSIRGAAITKALHMGKTMEEVKTHVRATGGVINQHYNRTEAGSGRARAPDNATMSAALRWKNS